MREQMQNQTQNANSISQSDGGGTRVAFFISGEILPESENINQKLKNEDIFKVLGV